jgi:hypothetical protein
MPRSQGPLAARARRPPPPRNRTGDAGVTLFWLFWRVTLFVMRK